MTEKKMNIIVPVALLLADGYYLYKCFTAKAYKMVFIGPYEFPKIIGIALALLCCITIVKALRAQEVKVFRIENLPVVCLFTAATLAIVFIWQRVGNFYICAPVYTLFLLFLFKNEEGRFSRKNIVVNVVTTAVLYALIYLIFWVLMKIRL